MCRQLCLMVECFACMPLCLFLSDCFVLLDNGEGAVMHVPAGVGSACHVDTAMSVLSPACLSGSVLHVRSGPRKWLYAKSACAQQVIGLTREGWRRQLVGVRVHRYCGTRLNSSSRN